MGSNRKSHDIKWRHRKSHDRKRPCPEPEVCYAHAQPEDLQYPSGTFSQIIGNSVGWNQKIWLSSCCLWYFQEMYYLYVFFGQKIYIIISLYITRNKCWIISSMFHLMKAKKILHRCQWDHEPEVCYAHAQPEDLQYPSGTFSPEVTSVTGSDRVRMRNRYILYYY
jgi:hypothetical protein